MNRILALLALSALLPACDDPDGGGGGGLSPGYYTLVSRQFGPCGAPVDVTDCPECTVQGPLVEVSTQDFGGISATFYSNCTAEDDCLLFAGTEGSVSKQANAQQTSFSSGGVCQYRTVDLEFREGEGGSEILLTTFAGEFTEAECDQFFDSDEVPARDRLTCQSDEIAVVAPR